MTSTSTSTRPSSSSSSGHTTAKLLEEGDHLHHHHQQQRHDDELPGFRFHPTDEELVGFYLRRKVDRKLPVRRIVDNLIKHVDIYKFDPWDLPNAKNAGDKECYFFCRRGRKYKNSIRPNRVTGSGFWKATGIDKSVYSLNGDRDQYECIIGLKKTLVYYRGCAGKGTKTDWMMHEFRLPSDNSTVDKSNNANAATQEAEVWTVCKIFKRNASYKRCIPSPSGSGCGWRSEHASGSSDKQVCVVTSSNLKEEAASNYISFGPPPPPSSSYAFPNYNEQKPSIVMPNTTSIHNNITGNYHYLEEIRNLNPFQQVPNNNVVSAAAASSSSYCISGSDNAIVVMEQDQQFAYRNWDELSSVVEFALDHRQSPPHHHGHGPL